MRKTILSILMLITVLFLATSTTIGCSSGKEVLYLGIMVHLEGWDDEATNEDMFGVHADAARKLATIFEKHGAKVTFEARPEFVAGCNNWGDNVLLELAHRGHGIGVHADVGGSVEREGITQRSFAFKIADMKKDMDKLTGIDVLHVSGICSKLDWVKAAIDAGYKFTTGSIGYCAMSLPVDQRPEQYKDCPNPGECHGVIPLELKDRINPWRTSTGSNWLRHDPDGELVILSESGVIKSLAESAKGEGSIGDEFTQADIDVYLDMLEEALSYSDTGKVNILYVALSIGSPKINEVVYRRWLTAVQPYVDSGQVEWKTLPEMYSAYLEWEENN